MVPLPFHVYQAGTQRLGYKTIHLAVSQVMSTYSELPFYEASLLGP
jgi:hypothetical protein